MPRLLAAAIAACALISCVKARSTNEPKTSELIGHYTRTLIGGLVYCDAYFAKESAPGAPVLLEDTAFMTCNGEVMARFNEYFTGSLPYSPGMKVSMSLIRKIDGSTMTDTQIVY